MPEELKDIDPYRYQAAYSPGLQEYMEAISFLHYFRTGAFLSYEDAQTHLPAGVPLTMEDYCGGIFDLSGEMMRLAVSALARDRELSGKMKLLNDLRDLRVAFETLDPGSVRRGRDWEKKLDVMRASVHKVEGMVYGIIVRGKERPEGWIGEGPGDGDDRMDED